MNYVIALVAVLALLAIVVWLVDLGVRKRAARTAYAVLGVLMVAFGAWLGLAWAPPEREMGDVQRIMYVHVPAVWMALVCFTFNLIASMAYLYKPSWKWDAYAEAGGEVGVVIGALGVLLGSIWGRPTWGVWWDWDPRLTTAAICIVGYTGYMALRRFIEDPEKRARWSAVTAIIVYVDIPIIWYSVQWWNSLHQVQSTPKTVNAQMTDALRFNAVAFLFVTLCFLVQRARIAQRNLDREVALPSELPQTEAAP